MSHFKELRRLECDIVVDSDTHQFQTLASWMNSAPEVFCMFEKESIDKL